MYKRVWENQFLTQIYADVTRIFADKSATICVGPSTTLRANPEGNRRIGFAIICVSILILAGCQTSTDLTRNVLGLYTVSLENAASQSKIFNYPSDKVYESLLNVLKKKGVYVPIRNRRSLKIVAMGFSRANDTTEVGMFVKALDAQKTEVYIASKNPNLLERVSLEIFLELEKDLSSG